MFLNHCVPFSYASQATLRSSINVGQLHSMDMSCTARDPSDNVAVVFAVCVKVLLKFILEVMLECTVRGKLAAAAMHGPCSMADYFFEMFVVRLDVASSALP
jgi:hypothetical protein